LPISYDQACLVWQVCLLFVTSKWNPCVCVCISVKKLILIYLRCTCWHRKFETTGSTLRECQQWLEFWPWLIWWAYAWGKNYRVKNWPQLIREYIHCRFSLMIFNNTKFSRQFKLYMSTFSRRIWCVYIYHK